MVRAELIKRSPLRILESSIHGGGLGRGNIGVLAAKKGVGKTACLVHIATDKLFQDKPVIHVSYARRVDYIMGWYEDIFREIAKKRQLESAFLVHEEIIKNRVIMSFKQDAARTDQILRSVGSLIDQANFSAESVIIDGYDFSRSTVEDFHKFKEFAEKAGVEVWFSASLKGENPLFDESGLPFELRSFLADIDVLISLRFKDKHVQLRLAKDREVEVPSHLKLKLDPSTLLICEDC